MTATDPLAVVAEHLDAFNQHSTARLLAGFADDAVWATGQDVFRGKAELGGLFDDGLWEMKPSLAPRQIIAAGNVVAAQLREDLALDGERRAFPIAVFFEIDRGLIRSAKVYRECSADIV